MALRDATTKGFTRTSQLLNRQIRKVGESRGFAQSRLLTHWAEIVGPEIAAISRPVEVTYGRGGGFGATLTVLTTGANAPMLEMQKERLVRNVNAVYGYNAIARIRITQTAATGFAEGKVDFAHRSDDTPKKSPTPDAQRLASASVSEIGDADLRTALERLGAHILTKQS